MQYEETMHYLRCFSHTGAPVTDLSRMRQLLQKLGNPQKLLRFVHIAGTNGKGSTLAYCAEAAICAGYRTGQFTSPFVYHYEDRIRINNTEIPREALCRHCETIRRNAPSLPFSQFEITLAVALLYFQEQHCDLVFLETGIGGLLDATNVVTPMVSIITSISLDHTAMLGNTIAEIAAQKAGIIKPACPVVLALQPEESAAEVARVVAKTAEKQQAPLYRPNPNACVVEAMHLNGSAFTYHGVPYTLCMTGAHQVDNALTAIEVLSLLCYLGFAIPQEAIQIALARTRVGARICVRQTDPLVIVDGGHNPDGVRVLVRTLSALAPRPVIAVTGMLATKDYAEAAGQLNLLADSVICVDDFAPNTVPAEQLATQFSGAPACMTLADGYHAAVASAKHSGGTVVVCGSLYLAAQLEEIM